MSKQSTFRAALMGSVMLAAPLASTQASSGFYVAPTLGHFNFDDSTEINDSVYGGAKLGFQFDNFGIEAEYLFSSSETEANGAAQAGSIDFDAHAVNLDIWYAFQTQTKWSPYIAIGGGHLFLDQKDEVNVGDNFEDAENEFFFDVGGGLRYDFNDSWAFLVDSRYIRTIGNNDSDEDDHWRVGFAVRYLFGAEQPAPAVAAPGPQDSDGDGVYDHLDRCPDTPAGAQVDEHGCPIVLEETVSIEVEVLFDFDRDEVKDEYLAKIQEVADFLRKYPDANAVIEGHTDSTGTESYNQDLSQRRADAVNNVLTSKLGVDSGRVNSVGYGESRPVADNATAAGRAQNRRVISVIATVVKEAAQKTEASAPAQ